MNSILVTIKKMLGIDEDYTAFDVDIITNINSVFLTLNQLGVGPDTGFEITDTSQTWADFPMELNAIKTYIYLKVKETFDPPASGFVIESMHNQQKELEWRICLQAEHIKLKEGLSNESGNG